MEIMDLGEEIVCSRGVVGRPPTLSVLDRSLWWWIIMNEKPLALTQSCSAKLWHAKGIAFTSDVLIEKILVTWEELQKKFGIPLSQKKTYTLIVKAVGNFFPGKILNIDSFLNQLKW